MSFESITKSLLKASDALARAKGAPDGDDGDDIELDALRDLRDAFEEIEGKVAVLPDYRSLGERMAELAANPEHEKTERFVRSMKGWARLATRAIREMNHA